MLMVTYTKIEDEQHTQLQQMPSLLKVETDIDVFKKAYEEGRVTDLGLSDWENFVEHLKTLNNNSN